MLHGRLAPSTEGGIHDDPVVLVDYIQIFKGVLPYFGIGGQHEA